MKKEFLLKVLKWFANGDVGLSSTVIACKISGIDYKGKEHPQDPSDLNRCFMLLHEIPEAKKYLYLVKNVSPTWSKLIENWDELEKTFINEVGFNWKKKNEKAKITYQKMKDLIEN